MSRRILLRDVEPGHLYSVQVRSVAGDAVSDWSQMYEVQAVTDVTAPAAPSALSWVVEGTAFKATWTGPTTNSDGSELKDFRDFEVTVFSSAAPATKAVYYTTAERFDFPFEANVNALGTPRANVTIEVRSRDHTGNVGAPVSASASNPAPSAPTGLVATAAYDSIALKWNGVSDTDLKEYRVYHGTTAGTATTLVWKGLATSFIHSLSTYSTDAHYRVVAADVFNTESTAATAGPLRPVSPFSVDAVAPGVPAGLAITLNNATDGKTAKADVTWTAVTDTDNDLAEYIIGYKPSTETNWQYVKVDYTNTATTLVGLLPYVNYDFRIRAADWAANLSTWSSTVTKTATANTAPATVTGVAVTGGKDSLTIKWTANTEADVANGAGVYLVDIATNTGFTTGLLSYRTGEASLTVTGLAQGTLYYVRVKAVDSLGLASASWSTTVSATTGTLASQFTYTTNATAPSSPNTGDIWMDTTSGFEKQWSGSAWVNTGNVSMQYISAKGTDLVVNGTGYLKTNYNFATFFDVNLTDVPTGATASFYDKSTTYGPRLIDELIPFDPSKKYKFSFKMRQTVAGATNRAYGMLVPYDAWGTSIGPKNYMFHANTTTTLAQALNNGDTTIRLTSAANWYGQTGKPAGANDHNRSMIIWNWTDPNGKVWPQHTYSRNYWAANTWADGGVDLASNTITLSAPWAGGSFPVGTPVSNGSSAGSYMYMPSLQNQVVVPETWTAFSDLFTAGLQADATAASGRTGALWNTGVPPGTANVKVGWLLNAAPSPDNPIVGRQAVAAISFSDAAAAQATAEGAVKTYVNEYAVDPSETVAPVSGWSTSTPTRTPGTFVWFRTTVTRADGTSSTTAPALLTGNTGATGSQGIQGPAGTDGTSLYTWIKYADTPTTGMADDPTGKTYMGVAYNKTSSTESSAYADYQWSLIKGANGADGKGVSSTAVTYQTGSSGTVAPTGTWQASPTATTPGQFLWTRTITTYTDASTSTAYSVSAHGSTGSTGATGVGVTGTTVTYQVHTNGTTAPTGTWQASPQTTTTGQYLWTRTVTTYSDASTTTAYSVAAHGATGSQGIQGPAGADGQPTYTWIKYAPNGNPTSGQISDDPAGMTYIGIAYNKTTQTESNTPSDYQWALIQGPQGPTGNTGATGSQGPIGVGITSVTPYFAQVTTGAAAPAKPTTATPSAPWVTTEPAYVDNTELYRTEKILYTDATYSYTNVSKVSAYTAATNAIASANGKNKIVHSTGDATGTNYATGDTWFKYDGLNNIVAQWRFVSGAWTSEKIGNAVIAELDAGKLTAGSAFITDLNIGSGGAIKSAGYTDAGTSGFKLSTSGLVIKGSGNSVDVASLTAGTISGKIINVGAGGTLNIDATGEIKSNNYSAGSTGYRLGNSGLEVNDGSINAKVIKSGTIDAATITLSGPNGKIVGTGFDLSGSGLTVTSGTISAAALQIQSGPNLIPSEYASFDFVPSFYSGKIFSSGMIHGINAVVNAKSGGQVLGTIWGAATANPVVRLASSATDYNVSVETGKQYIISSHVRTTGAVSTVVQMKVKFSNGTETSVASITPSPGLATWTRIYGAVTVPAGVTALHVFFESTTWTANAGFDVDAVQVEEKIGSISTPSTWNMPGVTSIDAGIIRTGELRSTSTVTVNGASQPAWSVNMSGNAQFGDASVRGRVVVGPLGAGTNIAPNGGTFEADVTGYSVYSVGGTSPALARTTTAGEVITGTGSAKASGAAMNELGISMAVSPTQAERVAVRVKAKVRPLTSEVNFKIGLHDGTGFFTTRTVAEGVNLNVVVNIDEVFVIPVGKTLTNLYIYGMPGAEFSLNGIVVDDVEVLVSPDSAASYLASGNYEAGKAGWRIDSSGAAEFYSGTFRGDIVTGSAGSARWEILASKAGNNIYGYTGTLNELSPARIFTDNNYGVDGSGWAAGIEGPVVDTVGGRSPAYLAFTNRESSLGTDIKMVTSDGAIIFSANDTGVTRTMSFSSSGLQTTAMQYTLTMASGWGAYGSGYAAPRAYRQPDGAWVLTGLVKRTGATFTTSAAGHLIATIPASTYVGDATNGKQMAPCVIPLSTNHAIQIDEVGGIWLRAVAATDQTSMAQNSYVSLSGITFHEKAN